MEATYETCIIVIPTNKMSDGRDALEVIQNSKFESTDAVRNAICYDEFDPIDVSDVYIYSMDSFMDAWNNTDDNIPKKSRLKIIKNWFGYVQIKTQTQI